MPIIRNVQCDRCETSHIDRSYWLSVEIHEQLPEGGGIVTGAGTHRTYVFCSKCKEEIFKKLKDVMRANWKGF